MQQPRVINNSNRNEAVRLLHLLATFMENSREILCDRLESSPVFVSPPGLMCWDKEIQRFVYLLIDVRVGASQLRDQKLKFERD